jgi:hypothetical protein
MRCAAHPVPGAAVCVGMAAWGSLSQPWDGAGIRDAVAPVEGCSAGAKGDHSLKASQGWRVAEKYRLGR